MVERVLEHRWVAVVVLRGDEHIAVGRGHLIGPGSRGHIVLAKGWRHGAFEEGQWPILEVNQLKVGVRPLARALRDPAGNRCALPVLARAAQDNQNLRCHYKILLTLSRHEAGTWPSRAAPGISVFAGVVPGRIAAQNVPAIWGAGMSQVGYLSGTFLAGLNQE